MKRDGHRLRRGLMTLLLAGSIAGCSPEPRKAALPDPEPGQGLVILSVETGPRSTDGPIRGGVRCADGKMPPAPPCLADDLALAEAVLACGPVEATVDRGASHLLLVRFPSGLSRRFPGMPADLDIVRCVQSRVGFAFSAGIATGPDGPPEGDPGHFESLHSSGPREKRPG